MRTIFMDLCEKHGCFDYSDSANYPECPECRKQQAEEFKRFLEDLRKPETDKEPTNDR